MAISPIIASAANLSYDIAEEEEEEAPNTLTTTTGALSGLKDPIVTSAVDSGRTTSTYDGIDSLAAKEAWDGTLTDFSRTWDGGGFKGTATEGAAVDDSDIDFGRTTDGGGFKGTADEGAADPDFGRTDGAGREGAAVAGIVDTGIADTGNPMIDQNPLPPALEGVDLGQRSGFETFDFGSGQFDGSDLDALYEQAIRDLLQGPRDTTAEEEALKEAMQHELGAGLVGMRARMGRMGFGASGALGGMELDARAQAARDAAQGAFDLRERARAEHLARTQAGMQGHLGFSRFASEDAHREALLKVMADMYGEEEPGGGGDGGLGLPGDNAWNPQDVSEEEAAAALDRWDEEAARLGYGSGEELQSGIRQWPSGAPIPPHFERIEVMGMPALRDPTSGQIYYG